MRKYIALEEAVTVRGNPGFAERHGSPWAAFGSRRNAGLVADWAKRLPDIEAFRIPEMDKAGVALQVLSLSIPGIRFDCPPAAARDDAKFANDYLAGVCQHFPGRFRAFAVLPMQDPAAAAAELARCVQDLGMLGALVNDCLGGTYLDDPRYDEVWAAAEELRVPLYLHPGAPPADNWKILEGQPHLYGPAWSWAAETAGHALRVIYGGTFDRHPGAVMILGHMGEGIPCQLYRLDATHGRQQLHCPALRPSEYFGRNVLITTSGVFDDAALAAAVMKLGADSIMFSVDYPYEDSGKAVGWLEAAPLKDAEREAIAHGNAEKLLRLRRAPASRPRPGQVG